MKLQDNLLIVGILLLVLAIIVVSRKYGQEHFSTHVVETNVDINHPDFDARDQARIVSGEDIGLENNSNNSGDSVSHRIKVGPEIDMGPMDMDNYVSKTDIERAARASAREYCPVSPSYNPSDFVKKSEIDLQNQCPKLPDLKDYVLKSTIPPVQKCPSCVCPKVKVSAGMCKKCPEPKNNCPPPQPCGFEQCKDVVKCGPADKPYSCPKCPEPQPCPRPVEKVCPAFEIPKSNLKCPSPQPCANPQPCPNGEGRCPEPQQTKCKYYGVKDIVNERSVDEIVNELMITNDPKLRELLETLKYKMNLNTTSSPTDPVMQMTSQSVQSNSNIPASTTMSSENLNVEKYNIEVPTQPSPNSLPERRMNNNTNYGYDVYSYSIYSDGMYTPSPQGPNPSPTVNTNINVNVIDELNENTNRACDVNDVNCPYNTNINM
jgi:hypothetical protein